MLSVCERKKSRSQDLFKRLLKRAVLIKLVFLALETIFFSSVSLHREIKNYFIVIQFQLNFFSVLLIYLNFFLISLFIVATQPIALLRIVEWRRSTNCTMAFVCKRINCCSSMEKMLGIFVNCCNINKTEVIVLNSCKKVLFNDPFECLFCQSISLRNTGAR